MKKLLVLVLILIVAIVAGALAYFTWRNHFIRKKVPELVFLKSDSLYRITYGDVYIDEVGGEVKISNLYLRPDTIYKQAGENMPRVLLELYIPVLHLRGLQTEKAMLSEEVIARQLLLSEPIVTVYNNRDYDTTEDAESVAFTTHELYKAILRNLVRIKIDSITIDQAMYNMITWKTRDTLLTATPVSVSLYDLYISDSTRMDTARVLFARKATLRANKLRIHDNSRKYRYEAADIDLDSEQRTLITKSIRIVPLLSEPAFMQRERYQTDRYDVRLGHARFDNIRTDQVLDGNLIADQLTVRRYVVKIFRDKTLPRKNTNKVGRYPHQLLMKLPFALSLKQVDFRRGYIEYKEKNPATGRSGAIRFHDTDIAITNFTNRMHELKQRPLCQLAFSARFLDAVPLTVKLQLYPADRAGKFAAKGTLAAADATVFNQLALPLGMATIEKGRLKRLRFNLWGNDYGAHGTVTMLYKDLKVRLLEKEDDRKGELKKRGFASFLANATISDHNPGKDEPVRTARVKYDRDPARSFFNLLWKSIFAGVQQTVGIEPKDQKG